VPALETEPRVRVVAAGKAAPGMARAVHARLGSRVADAMLTADAGPPGWRAVAGSHPRPSAASEAAGRAALALADAARGDGGLLIVCLSGGASAMMAVPAEGLTVEDKAATTAILLGAGLDIGEINVVRRRLSAIKGGQLAARAGRSLTLAISDVCTPIDDDPAAIGSGPTVGDDRSFADALALLRRHDVLSTLPAPVQRHLANGAAGQVNGPLRSTDSRLRDAGYHVVASRHDAMQAAAEAARGLGYRVEVRSTAVVGEARHAARDVLHVSGSSRPSCVVSSGETVVVVRGGGRGGRNQELGVAALERIAALAPAALASIGTDGRDGPTDAAGAVVDSTMWARLGSDARTLCDVALDRNDSYPLLDRLAALVRTGPTGTNVGDLQVLLLGEGPTSLGQGSGGPP
jgi:hydroxypyruvate reductase